MGIGESLAYRLLRLRGGDAEAAWMEAHDALLRAGLQEQPHWHVASMVLLAESANASPDGKRRAGDAVQDRAYQRAGTTFSTDGETVHVTLTLGRRAYELARREARWTTLGGKPRTAEDFLEFLIDNGSMQTEERYESGGCAGCLHCEGLTGGERRYDDQGELPF